MVEIPPAPRQKQQQKQRQLIILLINGGMVLPHTLPEQRLHQVVILL